MKAAGHTDAGIVTLEDRNHVLDRIADTVIVGREAFPIDDGSLPQRRARHAGDNGRFAQQMLRCRRIETS